MRSYSHLKNRAHSKDNASSSPSSVGSKDENNWLNLEIIGNEYFEQSAEAKKEHEVYIDKVTKQELKLLQLFCRRILTASIDLSIVRGHLGIWGILHMES